MSTSLTKSRAQARSDAAENIAAMMKYGFASGSVARLDIEWYPRRNKAHRQEVAPGLRVSSP